MPQKHVLKYVLHVHVHVHYDFSLFEPIALVFGSTLVNDHVVDLKSVCLKPLYSDMAERMRKVG